jgi:hypothetical protein
LKASMLIQYRAISTRRSATSSNWQMAIGN